MAPQPSVSGLSTLRAVSFRLASTPSELLPHAVHHIAAALVSCGPLLAAEHPAASKDASDAAVVVHKFRTQLSTLLQDRSIHGRWAAALLVKAAISVGGWETLQKSGPWVRGLLNILTKPDPPATKKLCIITLTKIFILTRDYPTLVREITTPALTPFITNCLASVAPKSLSSISQQTPVQRAVLSTVLESFSQLLPRHPTTFRTFRTQIRLLLDQCIAPTPSNLWRQDAKALPGTPVSYQISEAARRLYVQLHHCAQKNAAADEWTASFEQTIKYAHLVSDKIFRSVIEDWQSTAGVQSTVNNSHFEDEVQELDPNELELPPWSGIYAGCERLVGTLDLLKHFLLSPTAAPVNLRLGLLVDLLSRLLSLTVPFESAKDLQDRVRINNQIGKDERESLWATLPEIHVAALDILLCVVMRFPSIALSIAHASLDQLMWVFGAERSIVSVRAAIYTVISSFLEVAGPSLGKSNVQSLRACIRQCCRDLLPFESAVESAAEIVGTNGTKKASVNLDTSLNTSKPNDSTEASSCGIQAAAHNFLTTFLSNVPATLIPHPLRTEIDRTAILLGDKNAMLASVLNPVVAKRSGKPTPSILPILARSAASDPAVEAIIRPRMPVIRTGLESSISIAEEHEPADENEDELMHDLAGSFHSPDLDPYPEHIQGPVHSQEATASSSKFATSSTVHRVKEQEDDTVKLLAVAPPHAGTNKLEAAESSIFKRAPSGSSIARPPSPKRARLDDPAPLAPAPTASPAPEPIVLSQTIPQEPTPQPMLTSAPAEATAEKIEPVPHVPVPADPEKPGWRERADAADGESSDDDYGELVLGVDTDAEDE